MIDNILNNFNLGKILWILKRSIFLIVLVAALGGVAAGYYGNKSSYSLYSSRVSLYVYSNPAYKYESNVNLSNNEFTTAKNLLASYMLVLESDTVLNKVIEKLDINYSTSALKGMISSSAVENTAVFYVYVNCGDPYMSMEIANALAEIAPDEITRIVKSGGVEVLDYATLPTSPYVMTNVRKYVIYGVAGGGILATLLCLFIGLMDTTIRKKKELENVFTIPILGDIPLQRNSSKKHKVNKLLHKNSPFAMKESYSTIRSNLLFTGKGEKCPCFAVTSANEADGKTLTCANLAISFAQLGKKTLLIDLDLRKPSTHTLLGVEEKEEGLSQYLACLSEDIKIEDTQYSNLKFLQVGTVPPNPAELIASQRFEWMLWILKDKFDYIFIDMSPIGIVSDPILVSDKITGYVLVVRANKSKVTQEKQVVSMIEKVNGNICGFVYNGISPKNNDYIYKHYGEYIKETSKTKDVSQDAATV